MADNKNQSDLFSSREVAEIKRVASGGETSLKLHTRELTLSYSGTILPYDQHFLDISTNSTNISETDFSMITYAFYEVKFTSKSVDYSYRQPAKFIFNNNRFTILGDDIVPPFPVDETDYTVNIVKLFVYGFDIA